MSRPLVVLLALALGGTPLAFAAGADVVPAQRAGEHIGSEVTVEGRVVATYDSPLATVLAFAPNFAGFTARILAGDRAKFPTDLETRYRGRLVQLTGTVTAYRGKPEMTIREPSQLTIVVDPNQTATPPARPTPLAAPSPSSEVEELRRALAAVEDRVGALESRLAGAEEAIAIYESQAQAAVAARATPVSRVRGLALGADLATVRGALGAPDEVRRGPNGGQVWS